MKQRTWPSAALTGVPGRIGPAGCGQREKSSYTRICAGDKWPAFGRRGCGRLVGKRAAAVASTYVWPFDLAACRTCTRQQKFDTWGQRPGFLHGYQSR